MSIQTRIANLELRTLDSADAERYHDLIQDNRAHLTRLGDYTDLVELSVDQLKADLARGDGSRQRFGVCFRGAMIGEVALIRHGPSVFGLGYWIAEAYTGHGLMTESVRAVIAHAVDDLRATEFWAGITPTNEPSIRLVGRLGFGLARTQETHLSFVMRPGGEVAET